MVDFGVTFEAQNWSLFACYPSFDRFRVLPWDSSMRVHDGV